MLRFLVCSPVRVLPQSIDGGIRCRASATTCGSTASSAASAVEAVARRPLQQTGGEVAKDLEVALVQEHDPVVVARELVEQGQRPRQRVHAWVERFDRRGTEPFEPFGPFEPFEFFQKN